MKRRPRGRVSQWCEWGNHRTCSEYGYGRGVLCACECHMTDQPRKIEDGVWAFPLPITKPLSMNDRQHWSAKAGSVANLRNATYILARAAKIPKCKRVRVTLVYEPRDSRRRDPINLSATLKPVQDGIVDAKVVPDDTPAYMESPMPIIDDPIGGDYGKLWVLVERIA